MSPGRGSRNRTNFQNRSGTGALGSVSVGSKTWWNQRWASAKRWFLLRCTAMVIGAWKNSSQL
jgi:hypothetical protein